MSTIIVSAVRIHVGVGIVKRHRRRRSIVIIVTRDRVYATTTTAITIRGCVKMSPCRLPLPSNEDDDSDEKHDAHGRSCH